MHFACAHDRHVTSLSQPIHGLFLHTVRELNLPWQRKQRSRECGFDFSFLDSRNSVRCFDGFLLRVAGATFEWTFRFGILVTVKVLTLIDGAVAVAVALLSLATSTCSISVKANSSLRSMNEANSDAFTLTNWLMVVWWLSRNDCKWLAGDEVMALMSRDDALVGVGKDNSWFTRINGV